MWENGKDVSKPDILAQVLSQRFSESQVREIIQQANSPEYKALLNGNTKEALDRGAFGCPWFWVKNSKGEEEPFFGSDRYVLFDIWGMVPAGDSGCQTQVMRTMKRCLEKGLITRLQIPLYVGISGPPMDRPRATFKGEGEDLSKPRCNFSDIWFVRWSDTKYFLQRFKVE